MQAHLALEIDALTFWERPGPGFASVEDYHAAYQNAVLSVASNAGLWLTDPMMHVSSTSNAADIAWFATHGDRTHRLRYSDPGEFIVSRPWSPQASCVVVQQVLPGVRLINPIPQGCTTPAVTPAAFMDTTEPTYADRDVFLGQLFDALCRNPGQPIDVNRIIESTNLFAWRATASHEPGELNG